MAFNHTVLASKHMGRLQGMHVITSTSNDAEVLID